MSKDLEHEVDVLKKQVKELRKMSIDFYEYVDTVSSPLYKRVWWWFGGYCFGKVGRWYSKESRMFKVWLFFAILLKTE